MTQPVLFDASMRFTVSELTRYLRRLFEREENLQDVWVMGEISNLSRPASGHVYFTLKDAGASLRCVIWRTDASRQTISPQDGMAVEAHGRIDIYETGGQYQLYVDLLRPFGEGALYQEFLRLKALLEAEGLFDAARKHPIPELPVKIGVVTSASGAALRDILNTLRRRLPVAQVILSPAAVQGAESPQALVGALESLNRNIQPDVILLARGGGSMEDLWAFNDERLVRAVAASQAPVITGIGHETDFTLADFAADLRAPTPTAAAELATAVTIQDLQLATIEQSRSLESILLNSLEQKKSALGVIRNELMRLSPLRKVQMNRQRLDDTQRRGSSAHAHRLQLLAARLAGIQEHLLPLNAQAVLARGYALVLKDGRLVKSRLNVTPGDGLRIRLVDGEFGARVTGEG